MNNEQKAEANRLIAELLGWKPVEIHAPFAGMNHYTPPAQNPPDYCGNDNDALAGIDALALLGREINIRHSIICGEHVLGFFKGKRGEERQFPFYDELSEGRASTLHDAFANAMVEEYDEVVDDVDCVTNEPVSYTNKALRLRPEIKKLMEES